MSNKVEFEGPEGELDAPIANDEEEEDASCCWRFNEEGPPSDGGHLFVWFNGSILVDVFACEGWGMCGDKRRNCKVEEKRKYQCVAL